MIAATTALTLAPGTVTAATRGPEVVTSGDCAREAPVIDRALARSDRRVDVDGDGRRDTVAIRTVRDARPLCRVFVGVRVAGGPSYSTHLDPSAVPARGFRASIIALPDLGDDPGSEVVVDTHARADSAYAQLFTLTHRRLKRVWVPGLGDGNVVVVGGGATFPHGADCTRSGALVVSKAELRGRRGRTADVVRRTYPIHGDRFRILAPRVRRATVDTDRLDALFPEFVWPNFRACSARRS